MRGVEIGGAGKNVLAIACGIVAGRGLGESARAALIARAFAELMRFARAFGGRPETLMGLSGLGDLVLTASSPQSRNFAFGQRLGAGASPAGGAAGGKLAEGAFTAAALACLGARRRGIEMPVAEAVGRHRVGPGQRRRRDRGVAGPAVARGDRLRPRRRLTAHGGRRLRRGPVGVVGEARDRRGPAQQVALGDGAAAPAGQEGQFLVTLDAFGEDRAGRGPARAPARARRWPRTGHWCPPI